MLFGDNYDLMMSLSLNDSLAMNILRTADGLCHVCSIVYFCHDFVLTDRTDAEMFLTFATDSSVGATKYIWKCGIKRDLGDKVYISLLSKFS